MKSKLPAEVERFRLKFGPWGSAETDGNNGAFQLPNVLRKKSPAFNIVVSDGGGWEHVSVSLPNRCPWWDEMCYIKDLFWNKDETVIQYHPPKSEYINCHPNCLHLWKPVGKTVELPPSWMVGPKG